MSMFSDNINRICSLRGTTLTSVCKKLELSTSKVTTWNNGGLPKEGVMLKLAEVLDCSVMDFFADEDCREDKVAKDEDEDDILRVFRSLSRRAKHDFMSMVYSFETDDGGDTY